MSVSDMTVEILKEDIRDEIRTTRTDLGKRIDATNERIDATNERLAAVEGTIDQRPGHVETALLDLAHQQRFVVRYTKALSERDRDLYTRMSSLEARVDKLETK